MNGNYSSIIKAIEDIIKGITDVKSCFTYEPQQITSYPAVTISPVGHSEDYLSLRDTKRQYVFSIKVYGQLDNTRTDTQIVIRDLTDKIIDTIGLQENITLGGSCDYSQLTNCAFKFEPRGGSIYMAELTLRVQKAYSRV